MNEDDIEFESNQGDMVKASYGKGRTGKQLYEQETKKFGYLRGKRQNVEMES